MECSIKEEMISLSSFLQFCAACRKPLCGSLDKEGVCEIRIKLNIYICIADDRAFIQSIDVSSSGDPLVTCAEACLREKICRAFLYQSSSYECRWTNHDSVDRGFITYTRDDVTLPPYYFIGRFSFYEKNQTQVCLKHDNTSV